MFVKAGTSVEEYKSLVFGEARICKLKLLRRSARKVLNTPSMPRRSDKVIPERLPR